MGRITQIRCEEKPENKGQQYVQNAVITSLFIIKTDRQKV